VGLHRHQRPFCQGPPPPSICPICSGRALSSNLGTRTARGARIYRTLAPPRRGLFIFTVWFLAPKVHRRTWPVRWHRRNRPDPIEGHTPPPPAARAGRSAGSSSRRRLPLAASISASTSSEVLPGPESGVLATPRRNCSFYFSWSDYYAQVGFCHIKPRPSHDDRSYFQAAPRRSPWQKGRWCLCSPTKRRDQAWRRLIGSNETAAPGNTRSNSRCSGRDGRSHFRPSTRTFARWRWVSPAKSRRQWTGRFLRRVDPVENGGGLLPGRAFP
jgi:hypothetical protein